mmetsp:Transcript_50006/g.98794  ORF Transcript_50006/g.98794 Transcript_50006/m.98794 type:complete len:380 (+) Transcript_50006:16-1155(+)
MWTRVGGRLNRSSDELILLQSRSSRRRRRATTPPGASNQIFSVPDLVGSIATFIEEKDLLKIFSLLNSMSHKESISASCWQCVNIYKWPEHLHFFYLLYLGRIRARIRTLTLRLTRYEVFVLQWLLQACDVSCLEELDVTFQAGDCYIYRFFQNATVDVTSLSAGVAALDHTAPNLLLLEANSLDTDTPGEYPPSCNLPELIVARCPSIKTLNFAFSGSIFRYQRAFFSRTDYLVLGSLRNLHTLRLQSLVAFDMVKAYPNITDLTVFGQLTDRQNLISIELPELKRLDFSGVKKGVWLKRIDCPKLEELAVTLGRSNYGSGVDIGEIGPWDAAGRTLDPDMSLNELLGSLRYPSENGWNSVDANVSPNFKLVSTLAEW